MQNHRDLALSLKYPDMRNFVENIVIWLLYVVASHTVAVAGLGFNPGQEYWYSLRASTVIKDAGTIVTSAEVMSFFKFNPGI